MRIISILTTGVVDEECEDFVHGDETYKFDRIIPGDPPKLIEGSVWIFVDWLLPELSGLEMCRRLRADPRTSDAHITILLEQDSLEDRRRALSAGADDYFVGRPSRNQILDRVMTAKAQGGSYATRQVETGDWSIDLGALRAKWQGTPIDLGPTEFKLLRFFIENPNHLLERRDIINAIGKGEAIIQDRTVDVWIGRLRRALIAAGARNPLSTVRGRGYVFEV
ncbi:response regulator transcription factor [Pontixanthobacter aquaemixtae]|uniref:DNA-binding response regulator n=1 Tax=Pontixanthobacter aquaemixtae TaxID=1958940 RepID=A0A844ZU27_9SPHN|nr:response regulator transcription factor [Pontixanthobacter aquaemixtae]MXO90974.1 DNA-binding response regulator [Pontixanthobacter aquaemixtae]